MKTISAVRFKEICLAVLDDLGPEGVTITKHGKPVARLIPFDSEKAELIGCLRDEIEILGDIESTGVTWDA